ncbi:MAG TPA: hypothetical protein VGB30_11145 [bacterium]|jgi:hypothetical protein
MKRLIQLSVVVVLYILIIGCGTCSSTDPVTPANFDDNFKLTEENNSGQTYQNNHQLWGYYLLYINPDDFSDFEIVKVRSVAGHWNVVQWLEQFPCSNCLQITKVVPSGNGTLLIDISIEHPFTNLNFTGFDIRGIAMFNGSYSFPAMGLSTPDASLGDGQLINGDGYTTLYNFTTLGDGPGGLQGYIKGKFSSQSLPTAILNGYIRHISQSPGNYRNALLPGSAVTRTYEIDMPDGPKVIGYAVDASWESAINKPVTDPMTDFSMDANCTEAWKIEVFEQPGGIGLTECGGTTLLNFYVFDWQGHDKQYPLLVEIPGLYSGQKIAEWVEDVSDFSHYALSVTNEDMAPVGDNGGFTSNSDLPFDIAVDSSGDVYANGGFYGTIDLDPGPGVDEHTSSAQFGDVLLTKWALDGLYIWGRTWAATGLSYGGINAQGWGRSSLHFDYSDTLYVVGEYRIPVDFDPGPGVYEQYSDSWLSYVLKLQPDGYW